MRGVSDMNPMTVLHDVAVTARTVKKHDLCRTHVGKRSRPAPKTISCIRPFQRRRRAFGSAAPSSQTDRMQNESINVHGGRTQNESLKAG